MTEECPSCGSDQTVEVTSEGPPEQSITICAECGSDEPAIVIDMVTRRMTNTGETEEQAKRAIAAYLSKE